jgi:phosphoribosylformylglycinamidine synthase
VQVLAGCHRAIQARCALAAHDCSEGGLAAAVAEMAIGGKLGARIDLAAVPVVGNLRPEEIMFSESQSRILLEVPRDRLEDLRLNLRDTPFAVIGELGGKQLDFHRAGAPVASVAIDAAERAWKRPLDLDGTLLQEVSR